MPSIPIPVATRFAPHYSADLYRDNQSGSPVKAGKIIPLAFSLAILSMILLLSSALAAEEWELKREAKTREDISVWVKPVAGNPLNAFRGQTEAPWPLLTALAVLADVEQFPEWVFQTSEAYFLEQHGPDLAYLHIKGIWPVSDRDGIARTRIHQDPDTLVTTVHSVAAPEVLPAHEDRVRLPALDNKFVLEPLDDGWTRITFETFVDPGGMIPAWLANLVAIRAPLLSLRGMQQRMTLPQYHLRDKSQLSLQLPGTEKMIFPGMDSAPTNR